MMDSLSKQELISTITKQADQIKRYEARLRDVVAAYKGLAKEKEALEISLKALNKTDSPNEGVSDDSVAALTLSLSTLTAEKARLEEAFQADKKVTRDKYENVIAGMKEETRTLVQQHLMEINNLKAKIAYEIQEREKERADHAAMMKELHVKLNSERKTKEKLEDKVVNSSEAQASQGELEKRVRDLSSSLEAARRRLQRAEARTVETPALLVRLQQKLALLEQSHSIAIREEQIKAKRVEESARKICARQEERVALLEGKLAELSHTVGEYDLRRRRDQQTIRQLKESLNGRLLHRLGSSDYDGQNAETQPKSETDNEKLADSEYLQTLIDKIHILKKELIAENEKLGGPIDITTVFKVDGYENVHAKCREELELVRREYETFKSQNAKASGEDEARREIEDLRSEVEILKEKVETYRMMLDEEKQEKVECLRVFEEASGEDEARGEIEDLRGEVEILKEKVETYRMMLDEEKQEKVECLRVFEEKARSEQEYHSEVTAELKGRLEALEKQLTSARGRYAALLDETDGLLRARAADERPGAEPVLQDVSAPPHMLHYAHELARKDLDISQLRREKHVLEGQYRDCQREATIDKERFKEVIRTLKEEIDRLRRIQSREGANLEYLKNVVMAYLMSTDYAGRKHMLNAIAAVLHFTTAEKNSVLSTL